MDIGILLTEATKYSYSDLKKVILLGLLFLLSFLIIPLFIVIGYQFKIIKYSFKGYNQPPDFENWFEMLIDGIKVFFVTLIYFLLPALIMFIGLFYTINSLFNIDVTMVISSPERILSLLGGTMFLGIILGLFFSIIFLMALVNMAYKNEIRAAFQFSEIKGLIEKIGWVDYLVWYIVMIIIGFCISFISSFLGVIPVIGWIILIIFIYPFFNIFYSRSLSLLVLSGLEKSKNPYS